MINNRYKDRFFIDDVQVYPTGAGLSKKYARETGRVFMRETLDGKIQLLRGDYSKIESQVLEHEFDVRIERWNGTAYYPYITGKCFKTNFVFDGDRRACEGTVKSTDRYEKLLSQINKELDLVRDLEPPLHTVKYKKLAMLQVLFAHHGELYNLVGGAPNLLEVAQMEVPEDYGFKIQDSRFGYIPGTADMSPDVSGVYEETGGNEWTRLDNEYQITLLGIGGGDFKYILSNINADPGIKYELPVNSLLWQGDDPLEEDTDDPTFWGSHTFESVVSDAQCRLFRTTPHIRILTDETNVLGTDTIALPVAGEDIGGYSFGYTHRIDPAMIDPELFAVVPSDAHTTVPTRFGKFHEDALHFAGEYFVEFTVPGLTFHPLLYRAWDEYSLWGAIGAPLQIILDVAATDKICHDAYELGDVIKYVLQALDPAVTFSSDVLHSQFFYKTIHPVTSEDYALTHFVTAKSNILIGDYDNPATRGIITFGDIEQLLLAANCYWYINKQGQFIIEHISYFKNGLSYVTELISNDLTVQIEPRTGKPWSYHTNKYGYKTAQMPELIEFSWMDEVSDVFKGNAIEILSAFAEKGSTETVAVSKFTSDIDYGQAVPANFSKDGFYILATKLTVDGYQVQYDELDVPGLEPVTIQNTYWAYPFLHEHFHRHNLPAPSIKINAVETTATTTRRLKTQELVYPNLEPNTMHLLRTTIGVCEIESMDVPFESRANKLKVLHDLD